MLINNTIDEYVKKVGSEMPMPGGGSVAGLNGSLGASLAKMVAHLTVNRADYQEYRELNEKAIVDLEVLVDKFQKIVDEDSIAYTKVLNAYKLPKDTTENIEIRVIEIQKALKIACEVPMETMQLAVETIKIVSSLVGKSNTNISGDLLMANLNLRTALQGAHHNVITNVESIKDLDFKEKSLTLSKELFVLGERLTDEIYKELTDDMINN